MSSTTELLRSCSNRAVIGTVTSIGLVDTREQQLRVDGSEKQEFNSCRMKQPGSKISRIDSRNENNSLSFGAYQKPLTEGNGRKTKLFERLMVSNHFADVDFPPQQRRQPTARLPPINKRDNSVDRDHHKESFVTCSTEHRWSVNMLTLHLPEVKGAGDASNRLLRINRQNDTGTSEHFSAVSVDNVLTPRMNVLQAMPKRCSSFTSGFRQNASPVDMNNLKIKHVRSDSVGLSQTIHDKFLDVIRGPKLSVGMVQSGVCSVAPVSRESNRKSTASYKLRHEYGKNIEKTWFFNEYLKKRRSTECQNKHDRYNIQQDVLYSPEPETDDALQTSDDEASKMCGGLSTTEAPMRSLRHELKVKNSRAQRGLETNIGQDQLKDDDRNSSDSDIEIIFHGGQLIQRKRNNKLRKKRRRQTERYQSLPMSEIYDDHMESSSEKLPLTDLEIRALRLKLRSKEKPRHIKGKRRFLQVANAIYIAVQFKNILARIRNKKKQMIEARQKRIARAVAKRLKREQYEHVDQKYERTNKPSLKDLFMKGMGQKMVYDVDRLHIGECTDDDDDDDNDSTASAGELYDRHYSRLQTNKPMATIELDESLENYMPPKQTKFELELRKVSLRDLKGTENQRNNVGRDIKKCLRYRKRRHSVPNTKKPSEFLMTLTKKPRRRHGQVKPETKQGERRSNSIVPTPRCLCLKDHIATQSRHFKTTSCPHKSNTRASKRSQTKTIVVQTRGLMRTYSLEDLSKKKSIELEDLLKDIQIPAKEIRLQILRRRFRRQRRKRRQIRLSPVRLPERPRFNPRLVAVDESSSDSATDNDQGTEDDSDFESKFVNLTPFVCTGVTWNKNARDMNRRTWTSVDVEREIKRITRVFYELKECRYLRLSEFHQAIISRLSKQSL